MSRNERLTAIIQSMDKYHYLHGGIHLVVIDGVADLIRCANDEAESVALVDEIYRLAGNLPHVHHRRGTFRPERVEVAGTLGQRVAAEVGGYHLHREGREPGGVGGEGIEGQGWKPAGYPADAVPLGQTGRDACLYGRETEGGERKAQGEGTV